MQWWVKKFIDATSRDENLIHSFLLDVDALVMPQYLLYTLSRIYSNRAQSSYKEHVPLSWENTAPPNLFKAAVIGKTGKTIGLP